MENASVDSERKVAAVWLAMAEQKTFGKAGDIPRRKDAPPRLVLHTTETKSLPNYSSPPHFTVAVGDPGSMPSLAPGEVKVWQHIALGRTAYALLHPAGTEETNHMGSHCVQIEIVTYVGDQPKAGIVGNRGHLPRPLMDALVGLVREILAVVPGINPKLAPEPRKWSASGSASPTAPQRFTNAEWRAFNGICGHEHVPANSHWDPGEFDITWFIEQVTGTPTGRPTVARQSTVPAGVAASVTPVPDAGWPRLLGVGDRSRKVVVMRGLLQALGYGDLGDSDLYNRTIEKAVRAMQEDSGIDVDGIWGPQSHQAALTRLSNETARADVHR